ncbi:hypothetical protein TrVE_jg7667 [Triparma verrucosa]|uniref:Uncharacterized protein n=2 Tax=Triparma TaxID=722752 RepID=A0A9W6ZZD0_9STRA|nr:hypothetical protein TrST_g7211 [Triparma strigata]GMH97393.1 hypothetical protein TrVE_jg7667 [Triparma verrucosa]
MLSSYLQLLKSHPFKTNMASALVIFSLGDVTAQYIEHENEMPKGQMRQMPFQLDYLRMNEMVLWSAGFYTPLFYKFYNWMDVRWPKVTPFNVVRKVGAAFLLSAPINSLFFAYGVAYPHFVSTYVTRTTSSVPYSEISSDTSKKVEAELLNTMKASAALWWPANAANFAFVPPHLRAIWTSVFSVVWSTYLSLVQHRDLGGGEEEAAVVMLMRKFTKREEPNESS